MTDDASSSSDNASFRHARALRDLAARAEGVQDPLVVALARAVEGAADTITELRTILDATRGAGQRPPDDDHRFARERFHFDDMLSMFRPDTPGSAVDLLQQAWDTVLAAALRAPLPDPDATDPTQWEPDDVIVRVLGDHVDAHVLRERSAGDDGSGGWHVRAAGGNFVWDDQPDSDPATRWRRIPTAVVAGPAAADDPVPLVANPDLMLHGRRIAGVGFVGVDHVAPAWWKRQLYRLAAPRARPGSRLDRVVRWLEQHP